mmetsp:Transcript_4591/g.6998  ORF Transcript_4591/g.6998 Transcript_4591/m.6998 type:complete len:93 (+) Transcript_4591:217-495(+)
MTDGSVDGNLEGSRVGTLVGEELGIADGTLEGRLLSVGCDVGTGVSTRLLKMKGSSSEVSTVTSKGSSKPLLATTTRKMFNAFQNGRFTCHL